MLSFGESQVPRGKARGGVSGEVEGRVGRDVVIRGYFILIFACIFKIHIFPYKSEILHFLIVDININH